MAEHPDLRIEQANTAIHTYIESLPGRCITPAARPEYQRLVQAYLDAVHERDDEEPARLAA